MTDKKTIVGQLGRDPRLTFGKDGKATTTFSVAVTRRVQQGTEWVDSPDGPEWFNVQAHGSLAENVANSLKKGSRVVVEGPYEAVHRFEGQGGKEVSIPNYISASAVGAEMRFAEVEITANLRHGQTQDAGTDMSAGIA